MRAVAAVLLVLPLLGGCDRPRGGARAEIVRAPAEGEVAEIVRAELERAKGEGRSVVVYVGATWCAPCVRLHEALEDGELDARFSGLRLLEFDKDRDDARLARAGYGSSLVPLLVVPRDDGTASGHRVEGSYKGVDAVEAIAPRLERMLARARSGR